MSDFSAKIQAILDTSNIPKDISKIEKTPIKFNNVSLDTNNLINQIQTALNNHSFTINFNGANLTNQMQQMGASAGNTFSNAMNSRVKIKPFDLTTAVRNTSSAVSKLRQEFSNLNVPTDAINNVLDNLTKLDLSITKITHSVGKNSIKLNISGIDEFGKAISLTETFSQKTGKLTNFNKTVTQSFKEKQQAVNSSNQAMKTSNKELEEAIKLQKQMFSERSIKYDNGAYLYNSNDNINSDLVRKASASFSDLEQRYNQLRNSLSDEQKVRVDSSEVELAFNRMKELQTLYANINDKATRLIDSDNIESTDAYLQLAKRYKGEYTELFGKFKDNLNTTQLHELENLANSTTSKFQLLTASYEDLRERMSTKIESNFDKMDADLSKLESDMRKIDNVSQSTKNNVNGLRTSLDNLKNTTDVSDRISQFDTYTEAFAKQRAEVTKLKIAQSDEKNVLNQIAHTIDEITRKKIDLINSTDVDESKILSQQIKDLESRLSSLKQNNENILTAEDKAAIKELENLQKINIQQVQNKFSSPLAVDKLEADILKAKNSFQKLADAPTEVRNKLEVLNRAFDSLDTATGTEQKIESFKKCQKALEEFTVSVNKAKAAEEQLKLTSQIKTELDDGTLKSKISQVTAEYQRLGETGHAKLSEIHKDIEKLKGLQKELTQLKSDPSKVDELAKKYKEFGSTLKTVQNNLKIVSSETKNVVSNLKLDTFDNNMVAWLEKNSKAAGQFGSSIADLRERLAQLKASGNATVPQFRQLQEEFRNIQSAARAAGLTGRDTASLFKESLSILTRYFSATTLIFRAISGFKQMCQTVVEVNTAMTGLYRITNLSAQQYEVLYDKMITSAKEYGATLTDIINSTSSWIRLGFNENVAERLSEITAMYMHVTDLDYDTAVKNLVTAYKGFSDQLLGMFDNDTAKSVEYIADIFDKLGNEMPVSAAQVGEGLTRCASVMQQAGATIEEASAMITGGGAITQDFATMGSALKIASLRIRSMKGELQALGEEVDENIESVSKVQTQILNLTHGKVNIFEEDGETFRDIFEVFRDIANIMPELKETEQADLLEIVAGKNRSNSIQSMLSNWDEVETALQKATEAQGTMVVENDKYMKSAQGHINDLKAAWQAFSATFVKSDFLTNSLTVLTKFVDVLDVLVDKLGTVPTVLGAIAAYASTKGVGLFKMVSNEYSPIGVSPSGYFGDLFSEITYGLSNLITNNGKFNLGNVFSETLREDSIALNNYVNAIKNGVSQSDAFNQHMINASQSAQKYALSIKNVSQYTTNDFVRSQEQARVSQIAQNKLLGNSARLISGYNDSLNSANGTVRGTTLSTHEFVDSISQSNGALGGYLNSLNGAKASLGGYVKYLGRAAVSTVGLKVATLALNAATMLLNAGLAIAVGKVINLINEEIHKEENLAKAAAEEAEQSKKALKENLEKVKSVDELIEKYQELKIEYDKTKDESTQKEIINIQKQISELVGDQAVNLDLVNGELSKQLDLLKEIQTQQIANNTTTAQAALNNSITAANSAIGSNSAWLKDGKLKANFESTEVLSKNIIETFSNNWQELFNDTRFSGNKINYVEGINLSANTDLYKEYLGIDTTTLLGKIEALESLIDELNKTEKGRTSSIYSDLVSEVDRYRELRDDVVYSLEAYEKSRLAEISHLPQFSQRNVSDADSFNSYLTQMSNELSKDSQVQKAIEQGYITVDNLTKITSEYMSGLTAFSTYYQDWVNKYNNPNKNVGLTDEKKQEIANKFKESAGIDESVAVSIDVELECEDVGYNSVQKSIYDAYKQVETEMQDLGVDTSKTIFGNIDTNNRQVLEWDFNNLEKYKEAIISWDRELSKEWDKLSQKEKDEKWNSLSSDLLGSYSTVYGGSENFDGIEIAFSPMLQTEDGAVLLTKDTVFKYINAIIDESGENWTTEDLLKLDAHGLEIDGQHIKNIIADVGEEAIKTGQAMHYVGENGAFSESFNMVKRAAKEAGKSVDEFLGLFELSPEQSFNELTEWFNNLSESDQSLVYDISVQTDNTQYWNLIKWQKELDLIKESGMSSAESLQIFNEMMSNTKDDGFPKYIKTYRENIEALNDALFKLNSGEELSKSDRLTLLEKFPSLSGAINSTSALKSAISNLIKETNLGLDDKFAEAIKEVGGVATESGKALLEYQSLLKTTKDTTFDFDIEKETEKFSAMYSAISESVSGTGVSQKSIDTLKEMFSGLGGYKTADLFEKTAHGIHLNAEELRKLQKEYENTKKKEFADQIENLKQKYNDCTAAIDGLVEGSDLYNQKVAERDAILTEIENVEMLSVQYDGLTSAYNKWIKAKSAGNERDMYENMLSEVDTVQDLIDRGWAGSEEVRNYIELLGGKDLTTATVNEIIAEWDRLNEHIGNSGFTAFDFFTKDEDGKTVSDGIYNFFNTVRTVMGEEFAKLNGDGTWTFNFTNTKDIAEQLGLGVEYVETILRAASDAGFNINFNVQNTKAIDEANEKIEKTEATVKELKAEPIKVDVDTEDAVTEINRVKAEIDKVQSNGEITAEVKAAITEDADAKLDLIAEKKVQLEQPTFMTISVDVLDDESLSDTLELLHNYQTAVNDVDKLKLLGESDNKIAEAQKKVDEYAKQISELSPEVKAKIGIDEKATVDDIKKKIEKNEIKIKTKLDIDEDLSFEEAIKRIEKSISGLSGSFAEELKKSLSDVLSDKDIKINADVSGISLVEKLYNAINELQGKTVSVKAKVAGSNLVDKLYSAIERLESKVVDVSASVNGTQDVNNLRNAIQELTDKTVTVTTILNEISGSGQVDGTAHANGTAYANGNWGAKDSGVALGGELGREIVVRDGKWFTVGDNGAEFFNYKKNDIIFNADQATQLLENGKITHGKKRGKSFAEGTAFYGGTGASGGGGYTRKVKTTESEAETTTPTVDTNPSGSGFYDTPSSSNSSGDSEKFIDRIAIKINRLQREISKLSSAVSNIFTLWSDRGKSLSSEIGKITEEIDVQERAAVRYLEEANKQISKYGLKQDWIEDIQNGGVAFSYLTNLDDLYEGYQTYQQWYEKYLDARDSVADLKKDLSQLYKDNFDNIQKDFENQLALNQSVKDENEKDFTATTDYFSEMRKIESKNLDILNDELSGLESSLEKAVNSGAIQEGSEAWQEMKVAIDDVNRSISETNVELAKLYQEHFSYIQEGYENQIESYKSLRSENEKTYKKDTNYFSEMRDIQHKNIAALENELEDLEAVYDEAMDSGRIEMYSDAWYEMRKGIDDTKRAISDANVELAKLYQDNFNYIEQNYQNQLSLYEHYSNIYSSKATLLQTQGYMASSKLIERQMAIQNKNVEITKKQISDLTKELNEAMDSGRIEQYSDAWYNMQASIDAARESLYKTNNEIANLQNSMRQLDWDKFDLQQEMYSQLNDEADFLINLMSFTDLYDKKGNLTDTGIATMGLHNFNVTVSKDSIEEYQEQIDEVDRQLAEKPYDLDLLKHRQELIKLQRESITSMENEQKAMVSLVENGIKAELSSLKELIDAYSDALDAQKDLYDYQSQIADKSKDIATIQKQLSAYANDNSEEARATVQKLKVDLSDAKKDLSETEYEKSIAEQKKLLNSLYDEYEKFLNNRLDDTKTLLEDMKNVVNSLPMKIGETLSTAAASVGVPLSQSMSDTWGIAAQNIEEWNKTHAADQQITEEVILKANDSWGNFGTDLRDSAISAYNTGVGEIITATSQRAEGIEGVLGAKSQETIANSDSNKDHIENTITDNFNGKDISERVTTTNKILGDINNTVSDIEEAAKKEAAFYFGDVDMDGSVTAADSLLVLRASVGLEDLTDVQKELADVNGDGKIDSSDSLEILRRSVGLSPNVKSYSTGGLADYTGIANIHGTKDKPELVLNANDTQNFMSLRDTLRNIAAKQDLSIIGSGYNVAPSTFAGLAKVSTFASGMSSPNVTQNTTVNLGGIAIDHVESYNDLISQMQKDKNFEKLVRAMTIDQMTGKGSLTKYEHRW